MIPLLASAHRDISQFKDPERFNPNNFLDDEGRFQSKEAFMPFAPGLREARWVGREAGWVGEEPPGQAPGA